MSANILRFVPWTGGAAGRPDSPRQSQDWPDPAGQCNVCITGWRARPRKHLVSASCGKSRFAPPKRILFPCAGNLCCLLPCSRFCLPRRRVRQEPPLWDHSLGPEGSAGAAFTGAGAGGSSSAGAGSGKGPQIGVSQWNAAEAAKTTNTHETANTEAKAAAPAARSKPAAAEVRSVAGNAGAAAKAGAAQSAAAKGASAAIAEKASKTTAAKKAAKAAAAAKATAAKKIAVPVQRHRRWTPRPEACHAHPC